MHYLKFNKSYLMAHHKNMQKQKKLQFTTNEYRKLSLYHATVRSRNSDHRSLLKLGPVEPPGQQRVF